MTNSWNKIKNLVTRFKGLTTIGFANIVINVISGLFWIYVARLLGAVHYGEISYLLAVIGIGTIISYLGSGTTLTVYSAKGVKIQSTVYFISIVAAIITAIVLFLIFYNIGVSLFVIGNVIFSLGTSELMGRKAFKMYAVYLISQKILMVGLAIPLYHGIGPNGIILGVALSFFPFFYRIYQGFRETKIDFSIIKPRLGFMLHNYILDLSRQSGTTIDKLIVAPMLGFALLGNYQLGTQFLSILGLLPGIVFSYILTHDASGNPNKKLKSVTVLSSIILAILGITVSPIVVPIFLPKFIESIQVIQIISLSLIPGSINLMYISKFLGSEKSKIVLVGSGIYLAAQIPAIILLGKVFGVNGVAVAIVLATLTETMYLVIINNFIQKKN